MTKKSNSILELNLRANCLRIVEILDQYTLDDLNTPINGWGTLPKENIELRQRMALLRKDSIKAEKHLEGKEY